MALVCTCVRSAIIHYVRLISFQRSLTSGIGHMLLTPVLWQAIFSFSIVVCIGLAFSGISGV